MITNLTYKENTGMFISFSNIKKKMFLKINYMCEYKNINKSSKILSTLNNNNLLN